MTNLTKLVLPEQDWQHKFQLLWNVINFVQETRRQQQAEAAERRLQENEKRGVKDPQAVKRKQLKQQQLEQQQNQTSEGGGLRVSKLMVYHFQSFGVGVQVFVTCL